MVTDDLGGGSQEDPLPRRSHDASFSAGSSAADFQTANHPAANQPAGPQLPGADAGDPSTSRVPLWNRLPRSIWLMSTLGLTIAC